MYIRRTSKRHLGLAGLLGCLVLLVAAPVATAAGNGEVSGKVTSAASHAGIEKVEVRFYKTENSWNREFTTAGGDYAATLEAGEYTVEFVPTSGSLYASQYYKEKLSYVAAQKITVEEGEKLSIDAQLAESDTISGRVISNASGMELDDIEATAYEAKAPNHAVATASNEW